jgi:hypothetical protein
MPMILDFYILIITKFDKIFLGMIATSTTLHYKTDEEKNTIRS